MKQEELTEIIENHQHYLERDCEGWEEMKAYLSDADLSGANLRRADLRRADLSCADLSDADLSDANLIGADLIGVNLIGADLRRAYLRRDNLIGAYLSGANLSGADLSYVNLMGANLNGSDLSDADIYGADLRGVHLRGADLSGADLSGATLRCADLRGANLCVTNLSGADLSDVIYDHTTAFFALACPDEGDFIGWKKMNGYIIKIRIPADAKRSSATTRECRCSHAEVLEIQNIDGSKADTISVTNDSYATTVYTVGETVTADGWDEDRWNECSHGIHFFITRDEAVRY